MTNGTNSLSVCETQALYFIQAVKFLTWLKYQAFHLVLVPTVLPCDCYCLWFMVSNLLFDIFILALLVAFYNFMDFLRAVHPGFMGFKEL